MTDTDTVTISRACLQHVANALDQCKAEIDEVLASPPLPSGLREAVCRAAQRFCEDLCENAEGVPQQELEALHNALDAWEGIAPDTARASPDDGWVKVDEEHPLPTLFPGDELIVRIQRYTGARSSIEYTQVAYRRRRSAEQGG